MGNCLSIDPPMAKVGDKIIRKKTFKKVKSYYDLLRAGGYDVKETTILTLFCDGVNIPDVGAWKDFHFVDKIKFNGNTVPITKLYGKQNGLKIPQSSREW
jgi:hypothetical protein